MSKPNQNKKKKDRLAAQRKRRHKQRREELAAAMFADVPERPDDRLAAALFADGPEVPVDELSIASFVDDQGLHWLVPGSPPDEQTLAEMTRRYQQNIRNSPLWEEMVRQFGPQRAEELLRQCRAELR